MGYTFAEKILGAKAGTIVFKQPDLVLTHDNTASIRKTFEKMDGKKVYDPDRLVVVLDHNSPPTNSKVATDHDSVRQFVKIQGIKRFHDEGEGICHQLMAGHARPGMIIVGSDSHTCTAGAFNALAVGIDRTEAAGIWRRGETWFRVPETIKIVLHGRLPKGVFAKDLILWIAGMIGSAGANYMSIEFHGDGVKSLSIADRMTIANMASELGAKNAVFPPDEILAQYFGTTVDKLGGVWADPDAEYAREIEINLSELFPVVAAPHHVDNIKAVREVLDTPIQEAFVGTCTNGRLEDLREADMVLRGKQVHPDVRMIVTPASREIYLQAITEGIIPNMLSAGANVLTASCGPCLGTGQGIPADGWNVISTANRNFLGRMGNKNANIYLASPATVAYSALKGKISDPREYLDPDFKPKEEHYPYKQEQSETLTIPEGELRRMNGVWNYKDVDNLNTDQMFAGNLTYQVLSSDPEGIIPHLFAGFDPNFSKNAQKGDIIIAGRNFGAGSSREHPAVGLAYLGIKAVIVKSVNRIFFRSSINQGLPIIVHPEAVEAYQPGDKVDVDFEQGKITVGDKVFTFHPLPDKLMEIIRARGLVNWIKNAAS